MDNEICLTQGHELKEVKSMINEAGTIAVFWNVCARCGQDYGHTSYDVIKHADGPPTLRKREGY